MGGLRIHRPHDTLQGMRNIPKSYPTFRVKCLWRATSITLKIQAKDELAAWDQAAKQVKKMFGGIGCLDIEVKGTIND